MRALDGGASLRAHTRRLDDTAHQDLDFNEDKFLNDDNPVCDAAKWVAACNTLAKKAGRDGAVQARWGARRADSAARSRN